MALIRGSKRTLNQDPKSIRLEQPKSNLLGDGRYNNNNRTLSDFAKLFPVSKDQASPYKNSQPIISGRSTLAGSSSNPISRNSYARNMSQSNNNNAYSHRRSHKTLQQPESAASSQEISSDPYQVNKAVRSRNRGNVQIETKSEFVTRNQSRVGMATSTLGRRHGNNSLKISEVLQQSTILKAQ
jgi:hypothetical protein